MGSGNKEFERGQISQQQANLNSQFSNYQGNMLTPAINTSTINAGKDYSSAYGSYQDFINSGGVDQAAIDKLNELYGSGGGGGGIGNALAGKTSEYANVKAPDYSVPDAGYTDFTKTGGVDQGALNQGINYLSGLAGATGGLSAADNSSVNRQSLQDIESTGGYTPEAIARIRQQAASNAPSYFQNVADQINQGRAITGNNAGGAALNFKLARQAAQQKGQDQNAAEVNMNNAIIANKMAAGQNLSQDNLGLLGLRSSNQLTAGNDIQQANQAIQSLIQQGKLAGLGGLASDQTNNAQFGLAKAGGLDQFSEAYAQLQQAADSANAGLANQRFANLAGIQEYINNASQQGKEFGTSGMADLYKNDTGNLINLLGLYGNSAQNLGSLQNQLIGLNISNDANNPSWWQKYGSSILGGIGSAIPFIPKPAGA